MDSQTLAILNRFALYCVLIGFKYTRLLLLTTLAEYMIRSHALRSRYELCFKRNWLAANEHDLENEILDMLRYPMCELHPMGLD